jgi:hypothetical protein
LRIIEGFSSLDEFVLDPIKFCGNFCGLILTQQCRYVFSCNIIYCIDTLRLIFINPSKPLIICYFEFQADLVDHDDSEFIIKLNTLNDIVVKYNFDRWIMTSARTGENVDQLIESLAKHAAELKPLMSENAGTRSQVIVQLEPSKSKDSKRIRKRDVIAQNCCKN